MKMFHLLSSLPIFPVENPDNSRIHEGFKYKTSVQAEQVSDGYHTMHELYKHRMALNMALFNLIENTSDSHDFRAYKSKNHHPDGDPMFEGYFIVWCMARDNTWTSYHYDLKYWDRFQLPEAIHSPLYPGLHMDSIVFFRAHFSND
jgi:hypothetical protein